MRTQHRFIGSRTPPLAFLLALVLLGACAGGGTLAGQEAGPVSSQARQDFFYARDQRVPVTIVPDSLAVVLRDGVTVQQAQTVLRPLNLRVVREHPANVVVLAGADSLSRAGALALARTLRLQLAEVVSNAGVMARPQGSDAPLFLTDEILVQFTPNASPGQVRLLAERYRLDTVPKPYLAPGQFVLRVTAASPGDALTTANRLHGEALVDEAQPNFIVVIEVREGGVAPQFIPDDALFGNQWHLHNTGQGAGTVDADIDAPEAWAITRGSASVVIAVIDDGFDLAHEDLSPNLWTNPAETAGNGVDDDGNGIVDDVNGADFGGDDGNPSPGVGDDHGTSVAGSAAARGNNAIGVSGSCPQCSLMLIRYGSAYSDFVEAFNYARVHGADVITNSWGFDLVPATGALQTAINTAGASAVVLFAMNTTNNPYIEDCLAPGADISSLASVIAVSASTNADSRTPSGYGDCMEVLAPTDDIGATHGTLWTTTTDRTGDAGYNNSDVWALCPSTEPGPPPASARSYTFCFGGTSFSTPVVAGIAGLILSANPALTPVEVRQLLNDAADKVEDSAARYSASTGRSAPTTAPGAGLPVGSTHGYGRANAYEALRVAAPAASGGLGGVDVFLRDNRLDWGNTEQPSYTLMEPTRAFIGHWESMDIKVDAGPGYQPAPTAATWDAFVDETPSAVAGDVNRVYVRVRNRGPSASGSVTVRLFWAQFGTALPALPGDFWTTFPGPATMASGWNTLNCSTGPANCSIGSVAYSGATVAGTGADAAQIVQFDFPAPGIDPALPNHFCLLAMVDAGTDRPLPLTASSHPNHFVVDWLTPNDNNVTHRNYHDLSITRSRSSEGRFFVRNPTAQPVQAVLRAEVPRGWQIEIDGVPARQPFALAAGEERLVTVHMAAPEPGAEGEVRFIQERVDVSPAQVMGGLTYGFRSESGGGGGGGGPAPVGGPRRALSLHAGVALPLGDLDDALDPGPAVTLDLVRRVSPWVAVDLRLGYSLMYGSDGADDVDVWDASANLKAALTSGTPWLFVNGGAGAYSIDSGGWEGGFNLGAGLGQPLGAGLTGELVFNYHRTFSSTPEFQFGKVQLGLLWAF